MADIDVERMKSIVLVAKQVRGPDPRFIPPRRSTADNREVRKLLAPLLEKASLDPAALEPFLPAFGRAQKLTFVRRPTTNSFLIRCVGASGLAIPMPGLMKY